MLLGPVGVRSDLFQLSENSLTDSTSLRSHFSANISASVNLNLIALIIATNSNGRGCKIMIVAPVSANVGSVHVNTDEGRPCVVSLVIENPHVQLLNSRLE